MFLSQPFKESYKDSKWYWKNPTNTLEYKPTNTLEKQFFSLYIPQVVQERKVKLNPLHSGDQHGMIQTTKKVFRTNYSFMPFW